MNISWKIVGKVLLYYLARVLAAMFSVGMGFVIYYYAFSGEITEQILYVFVGVFMGVLVGTNTYRENEDMKYGRYVKKYLKGEE